MKRSIEFFKNLNARHLRMIEDAPLDYLARIEKIFDRAIQRRRTHGGL